MRRAAVVIGASGLLVAASTPAAYAFHFYRSTDGGCSAADGALGEPEANVTANVVVGHNVFGPGAAGTGVGVGNVAFPTETFVKAGEAVTWTWNSAHCHSVTGEDFDSGFHYPTTPPKSPQVLPGIFDYPILDKTPTLSYTHTFTTPGRYSYFCVHHSVIGMNGVVVVQ